MMPESGEQPNEIKYASFREELKQFNKKTNNFIGFVLRRFTFFVDQGGDNRDTLSISIKQGLEDKGVSRADRERFFSIWYGRIPLGEENYEFSVGMLVMLKELYQDLLSGKYGAVFTERELNG